MENSRLCCPECDHCMEEDEWGKIKDENGEVTCPECDETFDLDDLLSEEEPEGEDE